MIEILKDNIAPFAFLMVAGLMCLMLPDAKSTEAIYLVIGAALTRVKRVNSK